MTDKALKQTYKKWATRCSDSEIAKLSELNETQVKDAFFRELAFGTGGLRGRLGLGSNRLNVYTVGKATQGLADYLNSAFENPTVALCRDTRHGSEEFVRRVAEVLAGNGIKSYLFDRVEPTPALSSASWAARPASTSPLRTTPRLTTDIRSMAPTAARSPSRQRRPFRRPSTPSTALTGSRRYRLRRRLRTDSCDGSPRGS